MPGGGYRAMQGQLDPLGREGLRTIADYVRGGGLYVGCCAGSYSAAIAAPSFVATCPIQPELSLLDANVWNADDSTFVGLRSPGIGVLRSRTVASGHPVMAGMPERFEIVHYNGPLFHGIAPLAVVEAAGERFTPAEHFLPAGAERAGADAGRAGSRRRRRQHRRRRARRRPRRPLRLASRSSASGSRSTTSSRRRGCS